MHGNADPIRIEGAGRFPVTASNVSFTGMLIHIDRGEMVHVNDLLKLTFHLLPAGKIIWLTVRIVWMSKGLIPALGNYSLGVLFFETPEEEVNAIFVPAREAHLHDLDPSRDPAAPDLPPAPPSGRRPIPGLPGV